MRNLSSLVYHEKILTRKQDGKWLLYYDGTLPTRMKTNSMPGESEIHQRSNKKCTMKEQIRLSRSRWTTWVSTVFQNIPIHIVKTSQTFAMNRIQGTIQQHQRKVKASMEKVAKQKMLMANASLVQMLLISPKKFMTWWMMRQRSSWSRWRLYLR